MSDEQEYEGSREEYEDWKEAKADAEGAEAMTPRDTRDEVEWSMDANDPLHDAPVIRRNGFYFCQMKKSEQGLRDAERLLALLRAPETQERGWRQLEEGDKDEEVLIGYCPNYPKRVIPISWDNEVEAENGQCWRVADATWDRVEPVLVRDLPSPPAQTEDR